MTALGYYATPKIEFDSPLACDHVFSLTPVFIGMHRKMATIHQLVQQTLEQGYLTIDVEQQLRDLVQTTQYSLEDMNAFVDLQLAAKDGHVRQESREILLNAGVLTQT